MSRNALVWGLCHVNLHNSILVREVLVALTTPFKSHLPMPAGRRTWLGSICGQIGEFLRSGCMAAEHLLCVAVYAGFLRTTDLALTSAWLNPIYWVTPFSWGHQTLSE